MLDANEKRELSKCLTEWFNMTETQLADFIGLPESLKELFYRMAFWGCKAQHLDKQYWTLHTAVSDMFDYSDYIDRTDERAIKVEMLLELWKHPE